MDTLKGLPKAPLAIFFLVPIGFLIGITARESYTRQKVEDNATIFFLANWDY